MMATRSTLVEAKIQHRPEDLWLVTGEPSKGILRLNVWVSWRMADGFSRMMRGLLETRAEKASLFLGSCSTASIHDDVLDSETAVLRWWGPAQRGAISGAEGAIWIHLPYVLAQPGHHRPRPRLPVCGRRQTSPLEPPCWGEWSVLAPPPSRAWSWGRSLPGPWCVVMFGGYEWSESRFLR
jgi:hypothetical protein